LIVRVEIVTPDDELEEVDFVAAWVVVLLELEPHAAASRAMMGIIAVSMDFRTRAPSGLPEALKTILRHA
jgi:hypothetical protein